VRNLFMRGLIPLLGGLIMYFLGGWSLWEDYDVNTGNSYTSFTVPGLHWEIGGVFVIVFLTALIGVIIWVALRITMPAYFQGRTLTRATPTLVPDE
jgi:ABC-type phosphate transport system permease subunit